MVLSHCTIPYDIMFDIVAVHLNLNDVSKLVQCSRELNLRKTEAFNIIITNDPFLSQYVFNRNLDLVATIEKSSFTKTGFFKFYDNVNIDGKFNTNIQDIDISKNTLFHPDQITIDATFELFKILMCCSLYHLKMQFRDVITTMMINYFKSIYCMKFKNKCDISHEVFMTFIENRDEILWYTSNINLYNIYENINLMHFEIRSFSLKQNIENNAVDNIVIVPHNHTHTISVLIKIFDYLDDIADKIYIYYSIFRYTTIMLLDNTCLENPTFNLSKFKVVISEKIIEFERDIECQHRSRVPRYLRSTMIDCTHNLKKLIINSM